MTTKIILKFVFIWVSTALFSVFITGVAAAGRAPLRLAADDDDYFSRYRVADGRRYDDVLLSVAAKAGLSGSSVSVSDFPDDPYYGSSGSWGQSYDDLWGLKRIGADASVWDLYRGDGIRIAIVDTGVKTSHEDITGNRWVNRTEKNGLPGVDDDGNGFVDDVKGWDFVSGDNDPDDLHGHGTHVAGIAAARGDNGKGIIGVAPRAKIMPVRVLNRYGSGTIENVAEGIKYAARTGAHIINLSLGAAGLDFDYLSILQDAVDFARGLGSIIVAAAGNSDDDVDDFSPANLAGVIAVGATDPWDERSTFSNFGSKLFITAPGEDILSAGTPKQHIGQAVASKYYRASGTSMAAPFVSGAIALLLDKYPGASLEFIMGRLAAGAVDLGDPGWDPYYGYGRLDIAAALADPEPVSASAAASSAALGEILEKQAVMQAQYLERGGAGKFPGGPLVFTTDKKEDLRWE